METVNELATLKPETLDYATLEWLADFEHPIKAVFDRPRAPEPPAARSIQTLSVEDADWLGAQEFPVIPEVQSSAPDPFSAEKGAPIRLHGRKRLLPRWRQGLTLSTIQNVFKPFGFVSLPPVSCMLRPR